MPQINALPGQGSLFDGQRIGGLLGTQLLLDGNAGLAEGVEHLSFAEARRVVFKSEAAGGVVNVEAAQAVEIGEFAETLKLFVAEGSEEFVADFE